jgi:hypothetical protein
MTRAARQSLLVPGRSAQGRTARTLRTRSGAGKRDKLDALLAIDMLGDNPHILTVARKLATAVEAPVLGGIAVFLHGYRRTTRDLDLYTHDRKITDVQLRAAGAVWDIKHREHVLDSVRIHTVTPDDAKHVVQKTSMIDGVKVVSLRDLIAIKLICGTNNPGRAKDIGDVQELIRCVPLDKTFAPKLPKDLRPVFKELVDQVRSSEKPRGDAPRF